MKKRFFLLLLTINAVFAQTLPFDSLQKARNYAHIYAPDSLGFRLISSESGQEIFTFEGKKVNTKPYENIQKWVRNEYTYLSAIDKNGKKALLSEEGEVLFTHEYDDLEIISKDVFCAKKGDKMGLINLKNEFIIPLDTAVLFPLYRITDLQKNSILCDSVIQKIGNQFFIYDLKSLKKTLLPLKKGIYEHFLDNLLKIDFFQIEGNALEAFFSPFYTYMKIKWTFENDKFLNIGIFDTKDNTEIYLYSFGDGKENEKKEIIYHTILDENGQVVLRGNWKKGISIEGIKDYLIIKDFLTEIDTVKLAENKGNPLLKESCDANNQRKKYFTVHRLIRLQDQKEIYKLVMENTREAACEVVFWGENKFITCENGKYGIMDLQGKWLLEPTFDEIRVITEEIVLLKKGEKNYITNQSLKMCVLPDGDKIQLKNGENGLVIGVSQSPKNLHFFAYQGVSLVYANSIKKTDAVFDLYRFVIEFSPHENIYQVTNKKGGTKGYIVFFKNGKKRFFPYKKYSFKDVTPFHYIILQRKSAHFGDFTEGLLDIKTGEMTLKCDFDAIEFEHGHYFCKKGDSIYWVDKTGEIFKKRKSYQAQIHDNQIINALIEEKGYKEQQYFSNLATEDEFDNIPKTIILQKPVQYGYINAEGKEIAPPMYRTLLKINDTILVCTNGNISTKINRYTAESTPLSFQVKVSNSSPPYAQKEEICAILDESLHLKSGFDYVKMEEWENFFLLVTTKDKKQGIADKSGKFLIPCKYEKIENSFTYEQHFGHYHFDTAFAKPANYFGIYENGKKIDIYNRYLQPISIGEYEKVILKSPVENCIVAMKNGKWGVISNKNEVIIPFVYSQKVEINLGASSKTCIRVETPNEILLFDYEGKKILQGGKGWTCKGDNFYLISTEKENVVFDANGKVLGHFSGKIQTGEDRYWGFVHDSLFVVKFPKNNKWNICNKKGEKILPWDCDSIDLHDRQYGYILYKDSLQAVVSETGKICLYPQKNKIIALKGEDLVLTYLKNQSNFYLHFDGKPYFPLGYDYYKMLNRKRCAVSTAGKSGCVDNEGKIIVPLEWENLNFLENEKENLYLARSGCDYYLLDSIGKKLYANAFEMIVKDGSAKTILFIAIQNGKYGLLDNKGKIQIPFVYDKLENDKIGNYIVSLNGKSGLLSAEGEEILPIIYDKVEGVQDDYYGDDGVQLRKDGLMGHYYHQTKLLIPPIYPKIEFYNQASAFILTLTNGKKGILSENGKELLPPIYDNIEPSRFAFKVDSHTEIDFNAFSVEKEDLKMYFYYNKNTHQWEMEAY